MWLDILIITLGFAGLIWGADKFVAGASAVALTFGVAPLMIGLTIVAFGTSAPEFFSSAVAAIEDQPELAIGNAVGSNIFNIGVALGIATVIRPLTPPSSLLHQELPALLLVTAVTGLLFADLYLRLVDSLVLIALLAYRLAIRMGISSGIMGLTIVAMATSLPELASTVTAVLRGNYDLAIGDIVGSNILNLLAVLPFAGLLAPGLMEPSMVSRDYAAMLLMILAFCGVFFCTIKSGKTIGRMFGRCFFMHGVLTMYRQLRKSTVKYCDRCDMNRT